MEGDFKVNDIGKGYDLILVSQIFHAFSVKENLSLLNKCWEALKPNGRVVVQEFPINESRTLPQGSSLFSVNMLVGTENGRCYTPEEMRRWLIQTGFKKITVKNLAETVCIIGRKNRVY